MLAAAGVPGESIMTAREGEADSGAPLLLGGAAAGGGLSGGGPVGGRRWEGGGPRGSGRFWGDSACDTIIHTHTHTIGTPFHIHTIRYSITQ